MTSDSITACGDNCVFAVKNTTVGVNSVNDSTYHGVRPGINLLKSSI